MEDLGRVGEDESEIDVGWRLLAHPRQRREDDRPWLTLDHFEDGYPFDPAFGDQPPEDGCLENPEPDIEPHADHDDAEHERNAPAPDQELVAGNPTEHQHRDVRQQRPGRTAELRPRRDETAMGVRPRPFHRQQYRATPFAADAHPLDEADGGQDDGAPDADLAVGRDEADGKGRETGQ